jgi:hypothetical protein
MSKFFFIQKICAQKFQITIFKSKKIENKALCSKSAFFKKVKKKVKSIFGFRKMDKNKCPKSGFSKKSWKSEKLSLSLLENILYIFFK